MLFIREKTFLNFLTAASVHIDTSSQTGKRIKSIKELSISYLLLQHDYLITFDHFFILVSDSTGFKLLIKKIFLMKLEKPVLNTAMKSVLLDARSF